MNFPPESQPLNEYLECCVSANPLPDENASAVIEYFSRPNESEMETRVRGPLIRPSFVKSETWEQLIGRVTAHRSMPSAVCRGRWRGPSIFKAVAKPCGPSQHPLKSSIRPLHRILLECSELRSAHEVFGDSFIQHLLNGCQVLFRTRQMRLNFPLMWLAIGCHSLSDTTQRSIKRSCPVKRACPIEVAKVAVSEKRSRGSRRSRQRIARQLFKENAQAPIAEAKRWLITPASFAYDTPVVSSAKALRGAMTFNRNTTWPRWHFLNPLLKGTYVTVRYGDAHQASTELPSHVFLARWILWGRETEKRPGLTIGDDHCIICDPKSKWSSRYLHLLHFSDLKTAQASRDAWWFLQCMETHCKFVLKSLPKWSNLKLIARYARSHALPDRTQPLKAAISLGVVIRLCRNILRQSLESLPHSARRLCHITTDWLKRGCASVVTVGDVLYGTSLTKLRSEFYLSETKGQIPNALIRIWWVRWCRFWLRDVLSTYLRHWFYVASLGGRQYFFRRVAWSRLISDQVPRIPHAKILVKPTGFRSVFNYRKPLATFDWTAGKLGQSLQKAGLITSESPTKTLYHYVACLMRPYLQPGDAVVRSIKDVHRRLLQFTRDCSNVQPLRRLSIAKFDLKACFDRIPRQALLRHIEAVLPTQLTLYAFEVCVRDAEKGALRERIWAFAPTAPEVIQAARRLVWRIRRKSIVQNANCVVEIREGADKGQLNFPKESVLEAVSLALSSSPLTEGIPQGLPISSLLCDFHFSGADERTQNLLRGSWPNLLMRWTDDVLVMCTSPRVIRLIIDQADVLYATEVSTEKTTVLEVDLSTLSALVPKPLLCWAGVNFAPRLLGNSLRLELSASTTGLDPRTLRVRKTMAKAARLRIIQRRQAWASWKVRNIFVDLELSSRQQVKSNSRTARLLLDGWRRQPARR